MTEWWQQGDDDRPIDVPRRNYVPPTEFSDPRIVTSDPELTRFVPEFRRKRYVIAWIITGIAVGLVVWAVVDVARWANAASPDLRPLGIVIYAAVFVRALVAVIGVRFVWRWARQVDPRDKQGGLQLDP